MALSPDCIEQHKKEQAISRIGLGWGLFCAAGVYGALIPLLSSQSTPLEQVELEPIELVVVAADKAARLTPPDAPLSPESTAAEQAEQLKELPAEPRPESLGSRPESEPLETAGEADKPEESETLEKLEKAENTEESESSEPVSETAEPEPSEAADETAETAEPEPSEAADETTETAEPESSEAADETTETAEPEPSETAAETTETGENPDRPPETAKPETASASEESAPAENSETTAAIAPPSSPSDNSADNSTGNGAGQRGEAPTGRVDAVVVGRARAPIEARAGEQGGRGAETAASATRSSGRQSSNTQSSDTQSSNTSNSRGPGETGRSRPATAPNSGGTRQFGCRGAGGCFQPDYPDAARQAGIEGTPVVYYDVDEDGYVINVRLATSSGNAALDRAAQEAVKQYRFTSGGAGQTRAVSIDFSLEGSERNRAAQQRGEQRTIEEPIQPAPEIESAQTPRAETTGAVAPATTPATAPAAATETTEQTPGETTAEETTAENTAETAAGTTVNGGDTVPETGAEPPVDDAAPPADVGPGEDSEALPIPTAKPQPAPQPAPQPPAPQPQQPTPQPALAPVPEVRPQPIPRPAEPAPEILPQPGPPPEVLPPAPEPPPVSPQRAEPSSDG